MTRKKDPSDYSYGLWVVLTKCLNLKEAEEFKSQKKIEFANQKLITTLLIIPDGKKSKFIKYRVIRSISEEEYNKSKGPDEDRHICWQKGVKNDSNKIAKMLRAKNVDLFDLIKKEKGDIK